MPLTATSTCRAPFCTPAIELATASPRSLWQCVEMTTSSGTTSRTVPDQLAELVRHRVPDGVGHVDRGGALLDRGPDHVQQELEPGARGVLRRELHVVRCSPCARRTLRRVASSTCSCDIRSIESMWMSLVEMNTCSRGDADGLMASHAASTSPSFARQSAAITEPLTTSAMRRTASSSPGDDAGNPASMMSTPRRASCSAISSFSPPSARCPAPARRRGGWCRRTVRRQAPEPPPVPRASGVAAVFSHGIIAASRAPTSSICELPRPARRSSVNRG